MKDCFCCKKLICTFCGHEYGGTGHSFPGIEALKCDHCGEVFCLIVELRPTFEARAFFAGERERAKVTNCKSDIESLKKMLKECPESARPYKNELEKELKRLRMLLAIAQAELEVAEAIGDKKLKEKK